MRYDNYSVTYKGQIIGVIGIVFHEKFGGLRQWCFAPTVFQVAV